MASHIICSDQDFLQGARKYSKEILKVPVRAVMDLVNRIATAVPNVRHELKQYSVDADMQFGNYDPTRTSQLGMSFTPRILKTYFASARREFDPNEYVHTVLSSATTKGEDLKNTEVAKLALSIIAYKLGDHLRRHVFNAVRDEEGTTTATLFNGWDTITSTEITGGGLAAAKGNLHAFTEAIDATNAVDALKEFCRQADDFLLEKTNVNLILPQSVYYDYLDDYKATTGAIPYNREFKQYYIEGFENIHLVPLAEKKGSKFLHLTTKDNMLVGYNVAGEDSGVIVEKHDVVMLTFFATMFFGVDFQSLASDRMLVGKLYEAPTGSI